MRDARPARVRREPPQRRAAQSLPAFLAAQLVLAAPAALPDLALHACPGGRELRGSLWERAYGLSWPLLKA